MHLVSNKQLMYTYAFIIMVNIGYKIEAKTEVHIASHATIRPPGVPNCCLYAP